MILARKTPYIGRWSHSVLFIETRVCDLRDSLQGDTSQEKESATEEAIKLQCTSAAYPSNKHIHRCR